MNNWRTDWRALRRSLFLEGSFVQNSAWMFTSSGLSIVVQFLFFPILSRIYGPEAYGLFGVFNFYTTTLGNAMTLGYNQAYVLPGSEKEFSSLVHLSLRISLLIGFFAALLAALFGRQFLVLTDHEELGIWVYFIAPVALFMAWDRMSSDWAIRNGEFRRQTIVSSGITLITKLFNVGYGLLVSVGAAGLIWTTMLQHGMRVAAYLRFVIREAGSVLLLRPTLKELGRVARHYRAFPLYIYWGNVLNTFSGALPAALLPVLGYGMDAVGYFAYGVILLDLPIRLLGSGVASVFQQKSAELIRDRPLELLGHTHRLFRALLLLSGVYSLFIWFFGEPIYVVFFGERWATAGVLAEWLVLYYFFRMVSSPLSVLFTTLRKERALFIFQLGLTFFRIASILIGAHYSPDFMGVMIAFSITNAVAYAGLCLYTLYMVRKAHRTFLSNKVDVIQQ